MLVLTANHPTATPADRLTPALLPSVESNPELDYWKLKVFGLQSLICDLLLKNERLRGVLQTDQPVKLTSGIGES